MKVAVVMNAAAGSIGEAQQDARVAEILEALASAGIEAEIHACKGSELTDTARRVAATGVDAVVAAGGDGTVSAVATALAGGQVPLAVLPLGTLNHFARDLGMPTPLPEAARALAAGTLGLIDLGEVNGRVFVNNSSIGLYPEIVVSRDQQRAQHGRAKWWAMLLGAARVLRRFPLMRVRIHTPERELTARTPFIFIGNNEYTINVLELGQRARLDRGQLALYMVRCRSRLGMFWLMVRAILQRLEAVADFEAETTTETWVGVSRRPRRIEVAVDGEVIVMRTPLHYRIRAGALPVILPPAAQAAEPVPASDATGDAPAEASA